MQSCSVTFQPAFAVPFSERGSHRRGAAGLLRLPCLRQSHACPRGLGMAEGQTPFYGGCGAWKSRTFLTLWRHKAATLWAQPWAHALGAGMGPSGGRGRAEETEVERACCWESCRPAERPRHWPAPSRRALRSRAGVCVGSTFALQPLSTLSTGNQQPPRGNAPQIRGPSEAFPLLPRTLLFPEQSR